jgi:hypothetical protein
MTHRQIREEFMAKSVEERNSIFKQRVQEVARAQGRPSHATDMSACDCINGMQDEVRDAIQDIKKGANVDIRSKPILLG